MMYIKISYNICMRYTLLFANRGGWSCILPPLIMKEYKIEHRQKKGTVMSGISFRREDN